MSWQTSLQVDYTFDDSMLKRLKEDYACVSESASSKQDLKLLKHMRKVIQFYSVPTDYDDWLTTIDK